MDVRKKDEPIRLNIGAGGKRYPGWIGVDAVERSGADVIAMADNLPFEDCTVDEVMAIHVLEHIVPWDVQATLAEWFRVLKPGSKIILEMPDIIKCCQNIIDGVVKGGKHPDQLGYWGAFGDPRLRDVFMLHRWGYTFKTLKPMMEEAGFIKVKEFETQFHPAGRRVRDFRLEAIKP